MASEAAMLGVPSVYVDNEGRGYTNELENKYGIVFNYTESFDDQIQSIQTGVRILQGTGGEWDKLRSKIISEKVDLTKMLLWVINNIPQSLFLFDNNLLDMELFRY